MTRSVRATRHLFSFCAAAILYFSFDEFNGCEIISRDRCQKAPGQYVPRKKRGARVSFSTTSAVHALSHLKFGAAGRRAAAKQWATRGNLSAPILCGVFLLVCAVFWSEVSPDTPRNIYHSEPPEKKN